MNPKFITHWRGSKKSYEIEKQFLDAVQDINNHFAECENLTRKGMIAVGFKIQRMAVQKAPVDTGNMRATAYVIWPSRKAEGMSTPSFVAVDRTGHQRDIVRLESERAQTIQGHLAELRHYVMLKSYIVEVGFSAYYTIYQHENTALQHSNGKEAKFLENAVKAVVDEIPATLAKYARQNRKGKRR